MEVADAADLSEKKATYRWLADGKKLGVRGYGTAGNPAGGFEYLGSLVYRYDVNGELQLESAAFGGGRILASYGGNGAIYTPNYFLADHLGSTRVVLDGSTGEVSQRNDYHAFGSRWEDPNSQFSDNRYLYNGKELQQTGNLKYLDYGARMYDARLARWMGVDPLAEKYYNISPYAYALNNPVKMIDPDGKLPMPVGTWGAHDKIKLFITNKEFRDDVIAGWTTIASFTDLDDATVIGSAIGGLIEGKDALHIDGTQASRSDVGVALLGLAVPVVSGSAVKKVGDALDAAGDVGRKIEIAPADKIDRDLLNPAANPKNAPTFKSDGTSVEIHHVGQNPNGPFREMHKNDHRVGANFKSNHTWNTPLSKAERQAFDEQRIRILEA